MPGRGKPHRSDQVSAADWVSGGMELLRVGGIAAVRVEPLAARLGVTKGSFYWHFADKAALHTAMLDRWRQRTIDVIACIDAPCHTPRAKLRALIDYVVTSLDFASLDVAVRAWASHHAEAAAMVRAVDDRRIAYISRTLRGIGLDPRSARARSQIVYLTIIGSNFAMARGQMLPPRRLWKELEALIAPR